MSRLFTICSIVWQHMEESIQATRVTQGIRDRSKKGIHINNILIQEGDMIQINESYRNILYSDITGVILITCERELTLLFFFSTIHF